ncbi:MAG: tetratricopeptide repeat protein [Deltaproteobacteria bacterium]|nr:tetratricopeptide repeat protein [Deltaproteobacteria bacterium]
MKSTFPSDEKLGNKTGLILFAVALGLRIAFLVQSQDMPSFFAPVIDAGRYDDLARSLAQGGGLGGDLFWQPLFYPLFLSLMYKLSGISIVFVKVLQMAIGSATCVLTAKLGLRLFGRRAGLFAGAMVAVYGPLIFFEGELLATGWAVFWSVALLLLFLHAEEKKDWWRFGLLGLLGGLAVITRPTFAPFFAASLLWLMLAGYQEAGGWRSLVTGALGVLLGFCLVALPVAGVKHLTTGDFGILPYSGGLNLYIGNNPDYCRTVTSRPGETWNRLVKMPGQHGVRSDPEAEEDFFLAKVGRYALDQPLDFASGLGRKTLRLLIAREIPRNVDVYLARRWSSLLHVLTWRLGGFGFPFGLLLPFALLGLVTAWRRVPWPLLLFLFLYSASIVLVFVSARYRLPLVPALAVLAGAGAMNLWTWWKQKALRKIGLALVFMAGVVMLACLPGPFCEEGSVSEAELYLAAGAFHERHQHQEKAIALYQQAAAIKPDFFEAHFNLAALQSKHKKHDAAIEHYQTALKLRPDLADARASLASLLKLQGRNAEAVAELRAYLKLRPKDTKMRNAMGEWQFAAGEAKAAAQSFRQVLASQPDQPSTLNNLAWILTGQEDPSLLDAKEAITLAERACELTDHRWAGALDTLAMAYAAAGKYDEAQATAKRALDLALADGNQKLTDSIRQQLKRWQDQK